MKMLYYPENAYYNVISIDGIGIDSGFVAVLCAQYFTWLVVTVGKWIYRLCHKNK